ncbi:uncharacterized protein FYW23_010992 [Sylvia borin]
MFILRSRSECFENESKIIRTSLKIFNGRYISGRGRGRRRPRGLGGSGRRSCPARTEPGPPLSAGSCRTVRAAANFGESEPSAEPNPGAPRQKKEKLERFRSAGSCSRVRVGNQTRVSPEGWRGGTEPDGDTKEGGSPRHAVPAPRRQRPAPPRPGRGRRGGRGCPRSPLLSASGGTCGGERSAAPPADRIATGDGLATVVVGAG